MLLYKGTHLYWVFFLEPQYWLFWQRSGCWKWRNTSTMPKFGKLASDMNQSSRPLYPFPLWMISIYGAVVRWANLEQPSFWYITSCNHGFHWRGVCVVSGGRPKSIADKSTQYSLYHAAFKPIYAVKWLLHMVCNWIIVNGFQCRLFYLQIPNRTMRFCCRNYPLLPHPSLLIFVLSRHLRRCCT